MSQNRRNPANEGHEQNGRSSKNVRRQDKKSGDQGFDGMNYEQRRGPYNPSRDTEPQRDDTGGGNNSGKRRDEN